MATNFEALISAKLDMGNIKNDISNLSKTQINLNNIRVQNISNLISTIQSQLDSHSFTINIDTSRLRSGFGGGSGGGIQDLANQIDTSVAQIQTSTNNAANTIQHMQQTLASLKFDRSSIDMITQDLDSMNLAINRVQTNINGNNLRISIAGVDELGRAVNIVKEFDYQSGQISTVGKTISQTFDDGTKAAQEFANTLEKARSEIANNSISNSLASVTSQYEKLGSTGHEQLSQISADIEELNSLHTAMTSQSSSNEQIVNSYERYNEVLGRVKNSLSIVKTETKDAANVQKTLSSSSTLSNNIETWMNNNAKAAREYGDELRSLQAQLQNNSDPAVLSNVSQRFREIQSEAKAAGLTTNTFAQSLANTGKQVLGLSSAVMVIRKIINEIKEGINTVTELDSALVDLRKTSTATPAELNDFYREANSIAKEYGATTREIIQGAADWSRLGYDLADSKTMSKLSSMFASISPGMSVEESTQGLVSVMKAFDIDAENALDGIMSKINIVGNNFAVSNTDVIEGLKRSSAAMAAMNQDLDSTIALFTAANEILQDPASTGTALRNMSLRIRGFDENTEELSQDLVELSGKIIDYTKTAEHAQGVSVFTDATQTHYKDFVDYFRELSEVWDEMSEQNQVGLLNDLFGKRGAMAGSALIQNFDQVEAALEKMQNSAGNAEQEMSIIFDSLDYKINRLKETGTGIWQGLIDRVDLGDAVDTLTTILEAIQAITDRLGILGTLGAGAGLFAIFKNFGKLYCPPREQFLAA